MKLAQRFEEQGLDWIVPDWAAPANVHGFATTRNGGDTGVFLPSPPVWLQQVHGTSVATVDAATLGPIRHLPPIADAAMTRLAGVPLAVRVADCLPVLFTDVDGSVVAAAHAGWRGLAAGVLEATISAMEVAPDRLAAWLGPAIGRRAFEVGDDVRDAFCSRDTKAAAHFAVVRRGKWLADLPALARMRLARAGVTRVAADAACTFSEPARFFSYRRDRDNGRMAAFVWRSAPL